MSTRTRSPLTAVLALVLTVLVGSPAAGAAPPVLHAEPTRVMALGDSITGSPGCWRALLWRDLQESGHQDVDFVGTRAPQGCGFPYDGEHEGHGGALVTEVARQNALPGWLAATGPDVVLMHFGTNDVWSSRSTEEILGAYDVLLGQMRTANPEIRLVVAQILPMDAPNCPECAQRVVDLNASVPAWAADRSTADSPVLVADHWTGFDTDLHTYDGVHPNADGDRRMADTWYAALTPLL
ncbi:MULTISPECIES: SGNH/GDSL hydrolase family protein [Actinoalloteichus]|uniref:GDSL-like Lipase/Acylhydrolase family protein n=1 Tax=Actinoalloteichus caeruleus DSM 43889 TaxID=1120930 RepID=A0ABT1JK68_ACTCY|nr:SGNH/GDSL hydrolase family protein [Actinoalloteichus caeruleus]MCP2332895.1 GDSL-like Lipase/Acylhydrolase family protein [Actinoalloteichus caeruleus DSM 43889]